MKLETLEDRAVGLIRQAAALPTDIRLVGLDEIAKMTQKSKSTVSSWHYRGQLPEPTAKLRVGPVWLAAIVEAWWAEKNL